MKKLLIAMLLAASAIWLDLPVQAQDPGSNTSAHVDSWRNILFSKVTEHHDYFSSQRTLFRRQPSMNEVQSNPGQGPNNMLEFQVFHRPRFVLWVQPVQQVGGFKLFFEF